MVSAVDEIQFYSELLERPKLLFEAEGAREIDYDSYIVKATLKEIRRVKGDTPRRARPLLPAMLRRIFVNLSHSPGLPGGQRSWCPSGPS